MRNIITACAALTLLIFTSCGDRVRGNGNEKTETRSVAVAKEIAMSGSFNVILIEGNNSSVEVTADENILPYIETVVEGDRLVIKNRDNVWLKYKNEVVVRVTMPKYEKLKMSGSGNLSTQGKISNNDFISLSVSGSGDVDMIVNTPSFQVKQSGSSDIKVSGETADVEVSTSGSGNYDGIGLLAEDVKVSISGSADIKVFADATLDIKISGSGNVEYKGNATVKTAKSGSGDIRKID